MSDFKCFDKTQNNKLLELEAYAMELFYGKEFGAFYRSIIQSWTKIHIGDHAEALSAPQRNSGDAGTAFGNTLITMCLALYVASGGDPKKAYELAHDGERKFEGDDNISAIRMQDEIERLQSVMKLMGVIVEFEFDTGEGGKFLKVQLKEMNGEVVATKAPIEALNRLFLDPTKEYKPGSQNAQLRTQSCLYSMYHSYGRPKSLRNLFEVIVKSQGRRYFRADLEGLEQKFNTPQFGERLRKQGYELNDDGTISRPYAKFMTNMSYRSGQYFDDMYGELVDNIIRAVEEKKGFYKTPDYLMEEVVTKGKEMPIPITTTVGMPFIVQDRTIRGNSPSMPEDTRPVGAIRPPQAQQRILKKKRKKKAMEEEPILSVKAIHDMMIAKLDEILKAPEGTLSELYDDMIFIEDGVHEYRDTDGSLKDLETPFKVPVLVWADAFEYRLLRSKLGDLAKKGVLIATPVELWDGMKAQDIGVARSKIKPFTSHNDKLGFDWSVVSSRFVVSYSEHFQESSYKKFIGEAIKAQTDETYKVHLKKV